MKLAAIVGYDYFKLITDQWEVVIVKQDRHP